MIVKNKGFSILEFFEAVAGPFIFLFSLRAPERKETWRI
jgi:hypothetical protein